MKHAIQKDVHRDTLIRAYKRLDPNNDFLPGTSAYRDTEAILLKWIRAHGPDRALRMVERSVKILEEMTMSSRRG